VGGVQQFVTLATSELIFLWTLRIHHLPLNDLSFSHTFLPIVVIDVVHIVHDTLRARCEDNSLSVTDCGRHYQQGDVQEDSSSHDYIILY
jgi:hypothetical protein